MKKTFLTSGLIIILAISPAIADDTLYKDTNIGGSCTADFLGGDGTSAVNSFLAQYTPNNYTVAAGEYLAQNGTTGTQCPANSYCAGGTFTFSETSDSGITACPDGFTLSAAGTSNENDCYHNCTASDIQNGEKVATIKGGTVTKGGTNTCDATCTTGYTFKASSGGTNPLLDKENIEGNSRQYKSIAEMYHDDNPDEDLIAGEFKVSFDYGTVKGQALCSTTSETEIRIGSPEDNSGLSCWCKLTNYTPIGEATQNLSSPWVFIHEYEFDIPRPCGVFCADLCSDGISKTTQLHSLLFESVDTTSEPAACVANEITIMWDQANGQGSVTNTCTYDGDITLPTAPTKTGYSFSGWKLVTGSSSNE